MQYRVKDIGDQGLAVALPIGAAWLAAECPDLEARPGPRGIALAGHLEKAGDAFLLRGDLRGDLIVPCVRCLEVAALAIDVPISVSYVEADEQSEDDPFAHGDEDDDDVLSFWGGIIDLRSEVRDEILLAIPIGPLCRSDCAGICPVCGGNRNAKPCDCEAQQRLAASKFAALKDVKV